MRVFWIVATVFFGALGMLGVLRTVEMLVVGQGFAVGSLLFAVALLGAAKLCHGGTKAPSYPKQQVIVHLDATGLPDEVYDQCDLETLETRLEEALAGDRVGAVDGNEMSSSEATVFLSGADAERLFARIEPVLRAYPLCRGARVEIRSGSPGSAGREVRLAGGDAPPP